MTIALTLLTICAIVFAVVASGVKNMDLGFIVVDSSVDPYYIVRDGFDTLEAAQAWVDGVTRNGHDVVWIDDRLVDVNKLWVLRWDAPLTAEFYDWDVDTTSPDTV